MSCGIYSISYGDAVYIGQSVEIGRRWWQHIVDLEKSRHPNSRLQRIFDKHGLKALSFKVEVECTPNNLTMMEDLYYCNMLSEGVDLINQKRPTGSRLDTGKYELDEEEYRRHVFAWQDKIVAM